MHTEGVSAFHFRSPEQRVKVVDFDVCQNAQKLIGYHSNVPWTTIKLMTVFVIPIHMTSYAERLTKLGLVIAEIFSRMGRFCHLVQKCAIVTVAISVVTGPNVTKIVHNVEKFILFNILKLKLSYCNPL